MKGKISLSLQFYMNIYDVKQNHIRKNISMRTLIYFILGVFFSSVVFPTYAANTTDKNDIHFLVDSLDKELKAMPRDSLFLYKIVGLQLLLMDSPKFLYYAELKEMEAKRLNLPRFVCESYSDRAIYYSNKNKIDSFYYWKSKMDPLALEHKEFNYYFYLANVEVNIFLRKKQIQQAIQAAKKMYDTAKQYDSRDGLIASNMSLGNAMRSAKRYNEAQNSFETALSLIDPKETRRNAWKTSIYLGLITTCDMTEDYSKGLDYIKQHEELIKQIREKRIDDSDRKNYMLDEWMDLQVRKATFYIKQNKYKDAQSVLNEVKNNYDNLSDNGQKNYLYTIANLHEVTGNYNQAFHEFMKAYQRPGRTNPDQDPELVEQKSRLLGQIGSLKEAIKSYQQLSILKDSLNNAWLDSQLNEFRTIYDTDQLTLKNNELELKNKQNQLQAIYFILILTFITLGAISILCVRLIRTKKKLENSEAELMQERDELVKSKESLRIAKEKAEEVRDMALKVERKESFFANMTHEIRTPLNAIIGFSNLLISDEEITSEEKVLFSNTINQNCEQLLNLVSDILDLSRMESGKMSFKLENSNLSELMSQIYSTHQVTIPKYLKFIQSLPDKPIIACVDKSRLKQVLSNFINNAVKFTTEGFIKIGYHLNDDNQTITLFVEDTGRGIPEEHQKKIFERFYKQNDSDQGTGLGLSISSVIAEKLNGHLNLHSEVGKGSCFSIILPFDEKIN